MEGSHEPWTADQRFSPSREPARQLLIWMRAAARNDGANTAFVTFDHGVMVPQEQPGVTMIPAASGFSPRFAIAPGAQMYFEPATPSLPCIGSAPPYYPASLQLVHFRT